jgi:hypothetical protein
LEAGTRAWAVKLELARAGRARPGDGVVSRHWHTRGDGRPVLS